MNHISDRPLAFWLLAVPLVGLAAAASVLAGVGLADTAGAASVLVALDVAIAAAWHAAWLGSLVRGRATWFVFVGCGASVWACRTALLGAHVAPAVIWAVVLESAVAGLVAQQRPAVAWADRLAGWRRWRAALSAHLELMAGVIPWVRSLVGSLLFGRPVTDAAVGFARLAAAVHHEDDRLAVYTAGAVLPEALRQSLLSVAREVVTEAELARLEVDLAIEHRVLREVVAFRDRCAALTEHSEAERDRMAEAGHTFLLELVGASPSSGGSRHGRVSGQSEPSHSAWATDSTGAEFPSRSTSGRDRAGNDEVTHVSVG